MIFDILRKSTGDYDFVISERNLETSSAKITY